jgi:hypothetical protein
MCFSQNNSVYFDFLVSSNDFCLVYVVHNDMQIYLMRMVLYIKNFVVLVVLCMFHDLVDIHMYSLY